MDSNTYQEFQEYQEYKKMKKAADAAEAAKAAAKPVKMTVEMKPLEMTPPFPVFKPSAAPLPPGFGPLLFGDKPTSFAAVAARPPPPPPPPPPASVSSSSDGEWSAFHTKKGPLKIDWERCMGFTIMMTPYRGDDWSKHPNLFLLFKELYKEFPERFSLLGELHAAPDGRTYYSYAYEKPETKGRTTFHAYGHLVGNKFFADSVDIRIGAEKYDDAAKFNHTKWSAGSKDWAGAPE